MTRAAATHRCGRSTCLTILLAGALLTAAPCNTQARVKLESICTIYGLQEVKLTGLGLVVGLSGTGDGGKNLPAMRALAAALKLMHNPILDIKELKDADNVAIVLIEATVPKTGLRRGQKLDCHVSSFLGAKSLRGGRLLVAPVETAEVGNDTAVGLASGPIVLEDAANPTTGKIPGGVSLQEDFVSAFLDPRNGPSVTLLLEAGHASFYSASEVARVVNAEFEYEGGRKEIAKPLGPGVIEVEIPSQYRQSPVEFIALLMQISIENPHTQGRVVVNPKSGTVIVTGEVEISPVVIAHKNLTVEIGGAAAGPTSEVFRPVPPLDQPGRQSPQQLKTLVDALNQLQVPTDDVISIIRELHRSGKLHGTYDEH